MTITLKIDPVEFIKSNKFLVDYIRIPLKNRIFKKLKTKYPNVEELWLNASLLHEIIQKYVISLKLIRRTGLCVPKTIPTKVFAQLLLSTKVGKVDNDVIRDRSIDWDQLIVLDTERLEALTLQDIKKFTSVVLERHFYYIREKIKERRKIKYLRLICRDFKEMFNHSLKERGVKFHKFDKYYVRLNVWKVYCRMKGVDKRVEKLIENNLDVVAPDDYDYIDTKSINFLNIQGKTLRKTYGELLKSNKDPVFLNFPFYEAGLYSKRDAERVVKLIKSSLKIKNI